MKTFKTVYIKKKSQKNTQISSCLFIFIYGLGTLSGIQLSSCQTMCVLSCFSCVRLFATLWIVVQETSLLMEISRQVYWSGLPCPSPGALPDPGIEPAPLRSPVLAGGFFSTSTTWEALKQYEEAIRYDLSFNIVSLKTSRRKTRKETYSVLLFYLYPTFP